MAAVNSNFQIFVIGFKVGTILPWPLNALITLMLVGAGFATWMAVLLLSEIRMRGSVFPVMTLLLIAALILSKTMLSRAMIIMYLVPIAYAVYRNAALLKNLSHKKFWVLLVCMFVLVVSNFLLSTT